MGKLECPAANWAGQLDGEQTIPTILMECLNLDTFP